MKKRNEKGSFTIEAILALSIFMFAFMAIVSLALVVKLESTVQYAIDQTAKEISQYCYIADRAGAFPKKEGESKEIQNVDAAVQAVFDFSDLTNDKVAKYSEKDFTSLSFDEILNEVDDAEADITEIQTASEEIYNSFKTVMDDPQGVVKALAKMMLTSATKRVVSRVIAQPLCKALVPKYMTTGGDIDTELKQMGIVDGLNGLDFRLSSFLIDDRTINVVVVYKVKVNGFGIFDKDIIVKQTASTAAWVKGVSLADVAKATPKWELPSVERGKLYVEELKKEQSSNAVKGGKGIDIYEQSSNTFTSVMSINVFQASYSDYNSGGKTYTLKESPIKSLLRKNANKLKKDIGKINDELTMEDGRKCEIATEQTAPSVKILCVVVPNEAQDKNDVLNKIAKDIEEETGVKVKWTYRDNALGKEEKEEEEETE